jgi:hypothetical protein
MIGGEGDELGFAVTQTAGYNLICRPTPIRG